MPEKQLPVFAVSFHNLYTIICRNCKVKSLTAPAVGKWADSWCETKNHPCNIYFAILSITISINKQMSPKKLFSHYTSLGMICQVRLLFLHNSMSPIDSCSFPDKKNNPTRTIMILVGFDILLEVA